MLYDIQTFFTDDALEEFADKAKESLSELEAEFGQEEEKVKIAKMKQKLKLTWEDAAVVGQIENEKVK